jgi:predicted O-linked N-acetylglucosamine transferase (SPINDLY family)
MRSIQYRISDVHLDPAGETEAFNTEELLRLPHSFWCYLIDRDLPPPGDPPVLKNGHITFGSLNNPSKVTLDTIDLWSRVMQAVPASKIMLLIYDRNGENEYFQEEFASRGITRERLLLVRQRPRFQYLQLHQEIDIILDTMPYNGHNTSCDALLMGVPIVTLPRQTSVSRAGVSFLKNIGHEELIANTRDEFVMIALQLAKDHPRLQMLRARLREDFTRSPLCDGRTHAAALEKVYRDIWTRWCAAARSD